jgi:hypothetical protein
MMRYFSISQYYGIIALLLLSIPSAALSSELVAAPASTEIRAPASAEMNTAKPLVPTVSENAGLGGQFSFGDAPDSLLFSTQQIEEMRSVLRAFEGSNTGAADGTALVVEVTTPQALQEPSLYPVFYLSSIVYRHADDWTIWIATDAQSTMATASSIVIDPSATVANAPLVAPVTAGIANRLIRITPKTNNGELRALRVSAHRVDFSWAPPYMPAMKQRVENKKFASVGSLKHRLIGGNNPVYDDESESIRFSLNANQSFSAAFFNCFDGRVAPMALLPLSPPNGSAMPSSGSNSAAIGGTSPRADIDGILAAEQAKKPQ